METDQYAEAFRAVEKTLPGAGTSWLATVRANAMRRWGELGYPTPKLEKWRYTSVKDIAATRFRPVMDLDLAGVTDDGLATYDYEGLEGARIVFVNGVWSPDHSDLSALPDGVKVESLAAVLETDPESIKAHLGAAADYETDAFTALNTALMRDGVVVRVPKNTVVEAPIHAFYVNVPTAAGGTANVTHVRNLIVADTSSEVTVIETHARLADGVYFTNVVTELIAGENATVNHYKVQRESEEAFHVASLRYVQNRASTVNSFNVALGGAIVRNDVNAVLGAEGCHLELDGLYVLREKEHVDNYTVIEHAKPNCTSHELYKGILDDQSRGVFTGKIHVHADAQKTDAIQHNPNLILSEGALADSTPQLEIYADDVKCTHGSTIGQLDKDAIFYLRSRGLNPLTARSLLTYAFAREIVDKIKVAPVREKLENVLLARLPRGDEVRGAL